MASKQQQNYFGQGELEDDNGSDYYDDVDDEVSYQGEPIEARRRHRQVPDDSPQPINSVQDHISSMNRRVRRFALQIGGHSLKDLHANACKPEGGDAACVFTDEEVFKHRCRDSDQGARRFGNADKAVILSVTVRSYKSTYPVALLVRSNLFPGNLYTATAGQRAFYLVNAGSCVDFGEKGPVVYHPPITDFSDLSKAYEDLTESELHAQVMTDPAKPESKMFLIPQNHPIATVLRSPNNQHAFDEKTGEVIGTHYTIGPNYPGIKTPFDINTMSTGTLQVPEYYYKIARECLSGVISRLPHKPLKGMRFWVERAFQKSFLSPNGELSKYGCSSRASHLSAAVSTPCTLNMELEIQYSLQGVESQAQAFRDKIASAAASQ